TGFNVYKKYNEQS
ncbi:hypothetical protein ECEC1737_5770, partial [Escherichia coli EC1737]